MQAVPTGVVKGPDGALYMSQLTGFPFLLGGANVYRLDPRAVARTVYATGFTNAIDLDFGKHGTLYVLNIDLDSPPLGPSTASAVHRPMAGRGAEGADRAQGRDTHHLRRDRRRQAR